MKTHNFDRRMVDDACLRGWEVLAANSGTSEGAVKGWEHRVRGPHLLAKMKEHDSAMHAPQADFEAHRASRDAYSASDKAAVSGSAHDHIAARRAHLNAHIAHFNKDNQSKAATEHKEMMQAHEGALAHMAAGRAQKPDMAGGRNRDWRGGHFED